MISDKSNNDDVLSSEKSSPELQVNPASIAIFSDTKHPTEGENINSLESKSASDVVEKPTVSLT